MIMFYVGLQEHIADSRDSYVLAAVGDMCVTGLMGTFLVQQLYVMCNLGCHYFCLLKDF